jgi:two-component system sensor histidine kinase DegS
VAAAGKFCKDLSSTNGKVKIRFLASKEVPKHFDANLEIAAYRIIQESVMNALKHAGASTIVINLKSYDGKLVVSIADDGKGFDTAKLHRKGPGYGFGLVSMQERANLLHGKFQLDSSPSRGTTITVELSLK